MSERKSKQELDSADEVIRDYSLPNSWVDQGNLFFAATEYRNAYKELQEKLSVAREALEFYGHTAGGNWSEHHGKIAIHYTDVECIGVGPSLMDFGGKFARKALEKIKLT